MTEAEESLTKNGGGKTTLTVDDDEISINSTDLKVDVKDLINIGNFEKARSVKPVKLEEKEPEYVWMMPYCQITCVSAFILAIIFLVLGYKTYAENSKKSGAFKYAGFIVAAVGVIAFIAVIYINSVSKNNLVDSMKSFRRSKAANPQINKKLTRNATEAEMRV
ncbi:hypothetical protein ACHWQZ_G019545 [Mnemiopsis leidyi]